MKVTNGTVERNIYVETRGRSLRFRVEVSPLPKDDITVDFDQYEAGLQWARRRRVELLEEKSKAKKPRAPAASVAPVIALATVPSEIRMSDVFQKFRERELPGLAGAAADSSRLKGLEEWFGHLTLGELTYDVLRKWKIDRASGVLGFGRVSYPPGYSKNDIYRIRQALKAGRKKWRNGKPIEMPEQIVAPPSAQTIRHEIMLLRRALYAYFRADSKLNTAHGAWLEFQSVMQIEMPDKPEPRDTRVDEQGLQALTRELHDPTLVAFAQFAVMTTLRRSEVCSLRWEDLNLEENIILLRNPGYVQKSKTREGEVPLSPPAVQTLGKLGTEKKSKTRERQVPLLPPAIQILTKLGIQKKGPIFTITPSGISQAIRRAADRAGLYDVRLHDLRREGISRLLELLEATFEDVSLFSGHSDLKVLKDHYARPRASVVGKRLAERPGLAAMMPAT